MGGVLSFGPSSLSERKTNLKNSKQQQRKEQKEREEKERIRRRLLEQYGVLIPPVFLANKSIDDAPISSRASEKIVEESSSARPDQPYYDLLSWAYRRKRKNNGNGDRDGNSGFDAGPLLAQTLLTEYMMPGLFFSLPIASSGANDGGEIVAVLIQPAFQNASSVSNPSLPSFISLKKCFHRNSFLFLPFPWKMETFLPQQSLLSPLHSSTTTLDDLGYSTRMMIPSSMRFVADLSSPTNPDQTRVALTTHFLDPDGSARNSIESPREPSPSSLFWTKVKGSWVETEMVRPNWWGSGITMRMATKTTVNSFFENILLESCRRGNDAYHEYHSLDSTTNHLEAFLRRFRKKKNKNGNTQQNDESINVRVAAEYKESIMASNTNISLSSLSKLGLAGTTTLFTDTLLSLNLNGGGEIPDGGLEQQPPPLWLTLKQSRGVSDRALSSMSLNLCQVVTFDREVWNILEDRAPRVRNHLGWVCQIERILDNSCGDGISNQDGKGSARSASASISILSIGASAQFNRNVAAKAILESKIGSMPSSPSSDARSASASSTLASPSAALKFAFVFKRWLEPQASLSIIQSIDLRTGKLSFLGLGVEIESDKHGSTTRPPSPSSPSDARDGTNTKRHAEYRDTTDVDSLASTGAPPTKVRVQLPPGAT
mmetsp:Transcript_2540/g.5713  ORF Transcript_2540/g.5713 Transcript_2540/m.5713 type:complete len:658 (-) Transcript_2540:163-2136(-)